MEDLKQALLLLVQLLEKIVPPVPAADASQVLAHLARNTSEFSYDPEHGETYDRWLRRHEALFKREATKLEDAALARFLVRKLDFRSYERFRNIILPKLPRDIDLAETILILKRIFGPTTSNARLQEETPNADITSIKQHSAMSTSHGVQECFSQPLHPISTTSSHLPAPRLKQEGEKEPPAKSRKNCMVNLVAISSKQKLAPINNAVATQRELNAVTDTKVASTATRRKLPQSGFQPPAIHTINSRPTPSKSRPASMPHTSTSNINAKKQHSNKRIFKHGDAVFAVVHRSNSWRWEAATVIERVSRHEYNVWLRDCRRINRSHVNQLLFQRPVPETRTSPTPTSLSTVLPATVPAPDVRTNSKFSNGMDEDSDVSTTTARSSQAPTQARLPSSFLTGPQPYRMT